MSLQGSKNDNGMNKGIFFSSTSKTYFFLKHFFLSTRYYVVEMIEGSNMYHHFMFYQFAGTGSTGMLGLISKGQVLLQLRMFTFHYHTHFFFVNTCKMYPIQQIIGIFIFLEVCSLILLWISFKFHTIQLRFNRY